MRTPTLNPRRRFRGDIRAASLVEFALILPIALMMYAIMCVIAQGLVVKRNVVSTARTITDFVAQQSTLSKTNLDCFLSTAAAVMTPWPSSNLSVVVSQVQIKADGSGTVIWSDAAFSGTAHAVGAIIPNPGTNFAAGSYQILGEVSYVYYPLQIYMPGAASYTLTETLYDAPRNPPSIPLTTP